MAWPIVNGTRWIDGCHLLLMGLGVVVFSGDGIVLEFQRPVQVLASMHGNQHTVMRQGCRCRLIMVVMKVHARPEPD